LVHLIVELIPFPTHLGNGPSGLGSIGPTHASSFLLSLTNHVSNMVIIPNGLPGLTDDVGCQDPQPVFIGISPHGGTKLIVTGVIGRGMPLGTGTKAILALNLAQIILHEGQTITLSGMARGGRRLRACYGFSWGGGLGLLSLGSLLGSGQFRIGYSLGIGLIG
jgi:hypothetical protein